MKKNILLSLLCALLFTSSSFGNVTFIMKNYNAQTGTDITIPVKVTGFTNIMSIQGTIKFDSTKLSLASVQNFGLADLTSGCFNLFSAGTGRLTFSWYKLDMTGVTVADSSIIFSITFHVTGTAGTNSALTFINAPTPFEVVDGGYNTIGYTLVNGSVNIYTTVSVPEYQKSGFQLYQNEPNPFSDNTRLVFSLPAESKVNIDIYDVLGNNVGSFSDVYPAGVNSIMLDPDNIKGVKLKSGTYYFRVATGQYSDIKKMVLVR